MGNVGTWLVSLGAPAVLQILISLGIGVLSYAALSSVLASALGMAKSHFNSLPSQLMGFVGLMGGGEVMSIIAGGLIARVTLAAGKKFGFL